MLCFIPHFVADICRRGGSDICIGLIERRDDRPINLKSHAYAHEGIYCEPQDSSTKVVSQKEISASKATARGQETLQTTDAIPCGKPGNCSSVRPKLGNRNLQAARRTCSTYFEVTFDRRIPATAVMQFEGHVTSVGRRSRGDAIQKSHGPSSTESCWRATPRNERSRWNFISSMSTVHLPRVFLFRVLTIAACR